MQRSGGRNSPRRHRTCFFSPACGSQQAKSGYVKMLIPYLSAFKSTRENSKQSVESNRYLSFFQIFNGQNGDRISAEDYLLLFVDDIIPQSDGILPKIQRLKDKGVHVVIIGLGKSDSGIGDFYEKMASHPSDVNYLDSVILKHIVGDLTAINCRKVNCEIREKEEKKSKGKYMVLK